MATIPAAVFAAFDLDSVRMGAVSAWAMFCSWVADGTLKAPALMAGLAVLASLPVLAIVGLAYQTIMPNHRTARAFPAAIATKRAISLGLGWPHQAWITINGTTPVRHAVPREILSFGREEDNGVRLLDASVHRHHAILYRTPEAGYFIRDLSGADGNGVKVNSQRVRETVLMNGDRIELGAVLMTFEAQPA